MSGLALHTAVYCAAVKAAVFQGCGTWPLTALCPVSAFHGSRALGEWIPFKGVLSEFLERGVYKATIRDL